MPQVGIKELLEAGVHFGHQTRRWNPKMRRFIFGERTGIYIIDLLKTATLLEQAQSFASGVAHRGGTVLFVGTKKQARDGVKEIAEASGQPYVNHRWLGGLLTNFQTINNRIRRLHDLERYEGEGQLALLPTRERLAAQADLEKLRANLGGVKNMQRVPDALFVIDLKTEAIAVREAQRLRIPIIGLVDTNCDPDGIDYVVPGNDDAIRSCTLITRAIGDVVAEGRQTFRAEEERARREAEEEAARARREEEERAAAAAAEQEAEQRALEEADTAKTLGGEGMSRDQAEQVVADAVQTLGRPIAEGTQSGQAVAAAQAADEPALVAGATAGQSERGGTGAPPTDTAGAGSHERPARLARNRARGGEATPAAPSPIAAAAEAEAPAAPQAAIEQAEAIEAKAAEATSGGGDAPAPEPAAPVPTPEAPVPAPEPAAPAPEPAAPTPEPAAPAPEPAAPTPEPAAEAPAPEPAEGEGTPDTVQAPDTNNDPLVARAPEPPSEDIPSPSGADRPARTGVDQAGADASAQSDSGSAGRPRGDGTTDSAADTVAQDRVARGLSPEPADAGESATGAPQDTSAAAEPAPEASAGEASPGEASPDEAASEESGGIAGRAAQTLSSAAQAAAERAPGPLSRVAQALTGRGGADAEDQKTEEN